MMNFKGSQFEREIILGAVPWYVAYPISYPQLEGDDGLALLVEEAKKWGVIIELRRPFVSSHQARAGEATHEVTK